MLTSFLQLNHNWLFAHWVLQIISNHRWLTVLVKSLYLQPVCQLGRLQTKNFISIGIERENVGITRQTRQHLRKQKQELISTSRPTIQNSLVSRKQVCFSMQETVSQSFQCKRWRIPDWVMSDGCTIGHSWKPSKNQESRVTTKTKNKLNQCCVIHDNT